MAERFPDSSAPHRGRPLSIYRSDGVLAGSRPTGLGITPRLSDQVTSCPVDHTNSVVRVDGFRRGGSERSIELPLCPCESRSLAGAPSLMCGVHGWAVDPLLTPDGWRRAVKGD